MCNTSVAASNNKTVTQVGSIPRSASHEFITPTHELK